MAFCTNFPCRPFPLISSVHTTNGSIQFHFHLSSSSMTKFLTSGLFCSHERISNGRLYGPEMLYYSVHPTIFILYLSKKSNNIFTEGFSTLSCKYFLTLYLHEEVKTISAPVLSIIRLKLNTN